MKLNLVPILVFLTGMIQDQYRIDVTLATLYNIVERGGRPILMTHIGRPFDKKAKKISIRKDDSVEAVVSYLQRKLKIKFAMPQFHISGGDEGIPDIDTSINWLIHDLRARKIGGIYLPNTRWFAVSSSNICQLLVSRDLQDMYLASKKFHSRMLQMVEITQHHLR